MTEPPTTTEERPSEVRERRRPALGYDGEYFDDDYVLLPREGKVARRILLSIVAVLAAFGILSSLTLMWVSRQITPSEPAGEKIASVDIPKGATLDTIATILEQADVVSDADVFAWYARFKGAKPPQAGEYVDFRANSPMSAAVEVLNDGPVPETATVLTIIPGMWFSDALTEITKAFPDVTVDQLLKALQAGEVKSKYLPAGQTNWEGMLLPETYQISDDSTPAEILQKLVNEFDETLDELGYDNAQARTGRSAYELITIASLIEREAGSPPEEKGKISRVIDNRLKSNTPLYIDATIYYGLQRKGGSDDPLTTTDLETDTPYNTRKVAGLPPTPIALSSKDSLAAAINPIDGPWVYYVLASDDPPTHVFNETLAEHNVAVAECKRKGLGC